MIHLVASDIDGTIIGENNTISQDNIEAINNINKSNIDFTVCTGKPYSMMKGFCKNVNASYGIFGNGNQIINIKTGKEIYRKTLTDNEINICLTIAEQNNLHTHIYTENEIITTKLLYMDLRNYLLKDSLYDNNLEFKIVPNISEYINKNKPTIFKMIISSISNLSDIENNLKKETNLTIYNIKKTNQYKDMIINKEYEYLDISPSKTTKSEALEILTNHLNLSSSDVMAIGDNLNDIDMIKKSGIGVAVANAYTEVKDIAKYVTDNTVENSGFAEAVYKFIDF